MSSDLPNLIKDYLHKKDISVAAFERKAGLKTNVARNILRGQSKKPTGETLQALATVMGCTISDLLGAGGDPSSLRATLAREHADSPIVEQPEILIESLQCILNIITKNNIKLTVQQTLLILDEVYAYSIKKTPPRVDADFVEWFIKR